MGETRRSEGSGLDADFARRPRRESDRAVVPMRPGHAGGGKDPDFRCAREDDDAEVIDLVSDNTANRQEPSERARRATKVKRSMSHHAAEHGNFVLP
jgi:hypothetical protein